MQLSYTTSFDRNSQRKPRDLQKKLWEKVALLQENPQYPSLRTKRVRGTSNIWEASVDMAHRITFEYTRDRGIILRNCNGHEVLDRP